MPSPNCKTCGQLLPSPPEPAWTVERALEHISTALSNLAGDEWEKDDQEALAFLRSHIEIVGEQLSQAVTELSYRPKPLTREAWQRARSLGGGMAVNDGEGVWRWFVENGYVPGEE